MALGAALHVGEAQHSGLGKATQSLTLLALQTQPSSIPLLCDIDLQKETTGGVGFELNEMFTGPRNGL